MIHEPISINDSPQPRTQASGHGTRQERRWVARIGTPGRAAGLEPSRPNRRRRVEELIGRAAPIPTVKTPRGCSTISVDFHGGEGSREFALGMREFRVVTRFVRRPRRPCVCLLARSYLQAGGYGFSERSSPRFSRDTRRRRSSKLAKSGR
jgi:hypothetical protein